MNFSEKIVLAILKKELTGKDDPVLSQKELIKVDWEAVLEIATNQTVSVLAFNGVGEFKDIIPAEIYAKWLKRSGTQLYINAALIDVQNKILNELEEKGLSYAIIKGMAAAKYYPKPELRQLGDIDILMDESSIEKTALLLKKRNFRDINEGQGYHWAFIKGNTEIELHKEISKFDEKEGEIRLKVKAFFEGFQKDVVCMTTGEAEYFALDNARHGLNLLLHMQKHIESGGFGLRHLCDWAAFVNSTAENSFWEDKLLPFLKEIGLMKFASVITKTAGLSLGSQVPNWAKIGDNALCEQIIEDVFSGGNFGRNEKFRRPDMGVDLVINNEIPFYKKPIELLRSLHSTTVRFYPITQKSKVLHILMDIARLFKYLFYCLIGKRGNFIKAKKSKNERKNVFEQLEFFKVK